MKTSAAGMLQPSYMEVFTAFFSAKSTRLARHYIENTATTLYSRMMTAMNIHHSLLRTSAILFSTLLLHLLSSCSKGSAPASSTELAVQGLYSATISDNSEHLLIGSINHGGSLWQRQGFERLYNWNHQAGQFSEITSVAFSPDASFALTTTPLTMVLWDRSSGAGGNYWNAPSEILDADLLPTGRYALLGMTDHTASLFDVRNGGVQRVYTHEGRVNSVDSHAATDRILTGSDDFSAKLWSLSAATVIFDWPMEEEVQLVRLSPDGKRAFVMAKYASAKIFDTKTGDAVGEIPLGSSAIRRGIELTAAVFSSDGQYLLTGNANRVIQLWRISDMKKMKQWSTPRRNKVSPTNAAVLALAFLGEGRYLAVTSDGFAHTLAH